MLRGRWTPENRAALERLLAQKFEYTPIAVFDWDYTCIAGDTANVVFHALCRDLAFQFDHPDFVNWVEEIPVPSRILECVENCLSIIESSCSFTSRCTLSSFIFLLLDFVLLPQIISYPQHGAHVLSFCCAATLYNVSGYGFPSAGRLNLEYACVPFAG